MFLDFAAKTDSGRVRRRNEDNYVFVRLRQSSQVRDSSLDSVNGLSAEKEVLLLLVADGLGGEARGDLASSVLVQHFTEVAAENAGAVFASTYSNASARDLLCRELENCHEKLRREARARAELHGMGSTATVALVAWPKLYVAHVGDSRCYLFRGGRLRQLTRDHSMAQFLVDQGCMSSSEADGSPFRHQLWNAIGGDSEKIVVDFHEVELHEQDSLLLCTDGLTGSLPDEEVADTLGTTHGASEICAKLVTAANDSGGRDNITCVVARFTADKTSSSVVGCFDPLVCGNWGVPAT
jgi:protein phosphatase